MSRPRSRAVPALLGAALTAVTCGCGPSTDAPTFHRDIAPIVLETCAACHRPGGSGPFDLLDFESVRRHGSQIVEVTESGFMPPWQPEPGHAFIGERRLDAARIEALRRWVDQGMPEGEPVEHPAPPSGIPAWQAAKPDLVIKLESPYLLAAAGEDVFRNFIVPVPLDARRYVKAVDFRPGNPRVVHHAELRIDDTGSCRRLEAQDSQPGFGGMDTADAAPPEGFFVGWTPGRVPSPPSDEMAWRLDPGSDLIVMLHMIPSGKLELVHPEIRFYFADAPPTLKPTRLLLTHEQIDIPAGEADYRIEERIELPSAVEVLGIYPHAHYLGKRLEIVADRPEGGRDSLLRIDDWDFNWQDEYRFVDPVSLPAGTVLSMHYSYDNSPGNVRNPNSPPRRVVRGPQSTDEMGTLMLQLLPREPEDRPRLLEAQARYLLEKYPASAAEHNNLGSALLEQERYEEAVESLSTAIELDPTLDTAYYNLGLAMVSRGKPADGAAFFEAAIRLDPGFAQAHNHLGDLRMRAGSIDAALVHFSEAIRLRPELAEPRYNLGVALTAYDRLTDAADQYREALRLDPAFALAHNNLGALLQLEGKLDEASESYRRALELDPDLAQAHNNLGRALAESGDAEGALRHFEEAVRLEPDFELALRNLALQQESMGRPD